MVKFGNLSPGWAGVEEAWALGVEAADKVTQLFLQDRFKRFVELEHEKISWPWMIWDTKKRYIARCYEKLDPAAAKIDAKGVELVRRDGSKIQRDIYGACVKEIMPLEGNARTTSDVAERLHRTLERALDEILAGNIPWDRFTINKSLRASYKNGNSLPHVRVASLVAERVRQGLMEGDPPRPGDRIQYVVVHKPGGSKKVADNSEDPTWAAKNKMLIHGEYYIDRQLRPSLTRLVAHFLPNIGNLFRQYVQRAKDVAKPAIAAMQGNQDVSKFFKKRPRDEEEEEAPPPAAATKRSKIVKPKRQMSLFDYRKK
jgi:DNA polymerase zeta